MTYPRDAAADDSMPGTEPSPELARARRERDAAHAARGAAESARDRAEDARDAAEEATASSRTDVAHLQEDVIHLREQLRSARAFATDALEPEIADLHGERASLLQELGMLEAELQARARLEPRRPGGRPARRGDDGDGGASGTSI